MRYLCLFGGRACRASRAGALSRPGSINALFTHRVRVMSSDDLGDTLAGWLAAAYASAG